MGGIQTGSIPEAFEMDGEDVQHKMSRCGRCKLYDNGCEGNMCIEACVHTLQDYICDILARAEAAEARAEKAEKERDAAISDIETIMAYGGADLDTCEFCKNGQCYARCGTKPCLPKWRGPKEE